MEKHTSVSVSFAQIEKKNYSFSAGQFFEVRIEHVDITPEEFKEKMGGYQAMLNNLFKKGNELQVQITKNIKELIHE